MSRLFQITLVLSLLVLSCSEKREPVPYTYSRALTGETFKVWELDYYILKEEGTSEQRFILPDCIQDDQYIFYANDSRTFEVTNGRIKCEDDEPDIIAEGNWAVVNATATMEFIIPWLSSSLIPWTIEDLDEDDFEVSFYLSNEKSINVTFSLVEEGD